MGPECGKRATRMACQVVPMSTPFLRVICHTCEAFQVFAHLASCSSKKLSEGNKPRCQDTGTGRSSQSFLSYENLNDTLTDKREPVE